jgi:CubicO group peptidase (beta-lactamase class C family)
MDVQGKCDSKFTRVREAFNENFECRGEVGAAVAITVHGKPVVDLWGGFANKARTIPWSRDTVVNVFSSTKGLLAICLHQLVDQGRLDLESPVSRHWPKFAEAGKAELPVKFLLSHRAGLPAIRQPLPREALFDWNQMCEALAEQEPWWEPGTKHGYHAMTFGFLVGEVLRRISGERPRDYLRDRLAGPLGVDCQIGLAAEDEGRVAEMIPAPSPLPDAPNPLLAAVANPESVTAKAIANPSTISEPGVANSSDWRSAELPAANGHATARALATVYGVLSRGGELNGVRVLQPHSIERCQEEQSRGMDEVLLMPTRFSYGFMMSLPEASLGPGERSFGHPGAGGSLGFADPDAKVGFGYVMNQMGPGILIDPRAATLIEALYSSL